MKPIDHRQLQQDLIDLVRKHYPKGRGAAAILLVVDAEGQPEGLYSPGIKDPEDVREMMCRGITITYTEQVEASGEPLIDTSDLVDPIKEDPHVTKMLNDLLRKKDKL